MINEQSYRYLTGEEMKGFGDESAPIDVTRDERCDANTGKENMSIYIYHSMWPYDGYLYCVRCSKVGQGTRVTHFIKIILLFTF